LYGIIEYGDHYIVYETGFDGVFFFWTDAIEETENALAEAKEYSDQILKYLNKDEKKNICDPTILGLTFDGDRPKLYSHYKNIEGTFIKVTTSYHPDEDVFDNVEKAEEAADKYMERLKNNEATPRICKIVLL
jgi:hypothetical protein